MGAAGLQPCGQWKYNLNSTQETSSQEIYKMATKSIHITTFGCQMNKADSELSLGIFMEKGYRIAPDEASADIILFNTCSVRQHAEEGIFPTRTT